MGCIELRRSNSSFPMSDANLHESARQFLYCANRAAEFCWDNDSIRTASLRTQLRGTLYEELRDETDLTANLVQEAIRRAVQATKGCVERWKQGKRVSQPEFTSWSMVYDKRSATFYRNKVSLSTVSGRVECEFELQQTARHPTNGTFFRTTTSSGRVHYNTTGQPTSSTSHHDRRYDDDETGFRQIPGTKQSSVLTSASTASQ